MRLKRIGVLLPQSKAYPTISKDFMNGLRLSLDNDIDFKVEGIGLGNDQKELINAIQKLVNQEDVQVTTGLLGHNRLEEVFDFVEGIGEKLIYADLGATRPISLEGKNGIYCNSLDMYGLTMSLGKYLTDNGLNNVGVSTCYYDVGYGYIDAMERALNVSKKGNFAGHFITPLHPRENESELLRSFVDACQPDVIFGFHNGVFAKEHAQFVATSDAYKNLPLYTTPFSLEESALKEYPTVFKNTFCISTWFLELETSHNKAFIEAYMEEYGKLPTHFAMLGYENGLLIQKLIINDEKTDECLGPRGEINPDPVTNRTNFQHLLWKLELKEGKYKPVMVDILEKTELNPSEPTTESANGWLNAYLCH